MTDLFREGWRWVLSEWHGRWIKHHARRYAHHRAILQGYLREAHQ